MNAHVAYTAAAMPPSPRTSKGLRVLPALFFWWVVMLALSPILAEAQLESEEISNAMADSGAYLYESKLGSDRMVPYMLIYTMWIVIVLGSTLAITIWIRLHLWYNWRRERRLEIESGYSMLRYRDPERYHRLQVQLERMPITAFDNVSYSKAPATLPLPGHNTARRRASSTFRQSFSWLVPARFSLPSSKVTPYNDPEAQRGDGEADDALRDDIEAVLECDDTAMGKSSAASELTRADKSSAASELRSSGAVHPRHVRTLPQASDSGDIDL